MSLFHNVMLAVLVGKDKQSSSCALLLLNPSEKEAVLEPGKVVSHQTALFCPPLSTASLTKTL